MKDLSNNKGLTYMDAVVWVIALSMILSLIINVALTMIIIQNAETNTRRVLDGLITQTSQDIFDNLKNGSDETYTFNEDEFREALISELSLVDEKGLLCFKDSDGETLYRITSPSVDYEVEDALKLNVIYNIVFPIGVGDQTFTTMVIPQKVVAYYNLK